MSTILPETYLSISQYGKTKWPWKLRRIHRQALKLASKPIYYLNDGDLNNSRKIAKKITSMLDEPESQNWGDLAELYQIQQYLELLGNFPSRDRWETLCGTLPIMCGRVAYHAHRNSIPRTQSCRIVFNYWEWSILNPASLAKLSMHLDMHGPQLSKDW